MLMRELTTVADFAAQSKTQLDSAKVPSNPELFFALRVKADSG
jgi:hypothetical protein